MKALTITDLLTLSRSEIMTLKGQILAALPELSGDKRRDALVTLSNIRWLLQRRHKFVPI